MDIFQAGQLILQGGTFTALGLALMWIRDLQLQVRMLETGRRDDSSKIAILYERLMNEKAKNDQSTDEPSS